MKHQAQSPTSRLYVEHLPVGTDESALLALFAPFRPTEAVIKTRHLGRTVFGFVQFVCSEDATDALSSMANHLLDGMRIRVAYTDDKCQLRRPSEPVAEPVPPPPLSLDDIRRKRRVRTVESRVSPDPKEPMFFVVFPFNHGSLDVQELSELIGRTIAERLGKQ